MVGVCDSWRSCSMAASHSRYV